MAPIRSYQQQRIIDIFFLFSSQLYLHQQHQHYHAWIIGHFKGLKNKIFCQFYLATFDESALYCTLLHWRTEYTTNSIQYVSDERFKTNKTDPTVNWRLSTAIDMVDDAYNHNTQISHHCSSTFGITISCCVAVDVSHFLSFSEFYQQLCLFKQQISKVEGSDHSVTSIKDEKNISDMFVHSNFCQSI